METQFQNLNSQDQLILARSKLWTPELDKLLRRWKRQVEIRRRGHYDISRKWNKRHYYLGVPATVLATLIATGTLATFRNCSDCDNLKKPECAGDQWIRLVIGIIGIISTTLTATQTFVNYQESAETHKSAADNYESLYGTIESLMIVPGPVRGDPVSTLQNIRSQYDDTVKKSPNLPKPYQVELSFTTIEPPKQERQVRLPTLRPEDIGFIQREESEARTGASILKNLVDEKKTDSDSQTDTEESLEQRIQTENDFNSDEEDRDVCLGFDLDQMVAMNNTSTALAVANIAARRDRDVQSSLLRALEFEMKRLNDATRTPRLERIRHLENSKRESSPSDSDNYQNDNIRSPRSIELGQSQEY